MCSHKENSLLLDLFMAFDWFGDSHKADFFLRKTHMHGQHVLSYHLIQLQSPRLAILILILHKNRRNKIYIFSYTSTSNKCYYIILINAAFLYLFFFVWFHIWIKVSIKYQSSTKPIFEY